MTTLATIPAPPSVARRRDARMAGCPHNMGDYPAEIVYDGERPAFQHYRCNGCTIILRTERL